MPRKIFCMMAILSMVGCGSRRVPKVSRRTRLWHEGIGQNPVYMQDIWERDHYLEDSDPRRDRITSGAR